MTRRVSTEEAQAQLPALLDEVARGGGPLLIDQCGQPLAALVSLADLGRLQALSAERPRGQRPWSDVLAELATLPAVDDAAIDELVRQIYEEREADARLRAELHDKRVADAHRRAKLLENQ